MSWRKSREDDYMSRTFEASSIHPPRWFEVRRNHVS
jgi:hypothetical protein